MHRPSFQTSVRALVTTGALAALVLVLPTAQRAEAAGLRNCVDVTGRAIGRVGCWESVWARGTEYRMTFSNTQYRGAVSGDEDAFFVMAPQGSTAQGALPFPHDHTVRDIPAGNDGSYSVKLHGYFVICSAQGIASGACVPTMSEVEGIGTLPLARSVNGTDLTSVEPIEAAIDAGLLSPLDTGAVLVGSISGH
jgi:hypothetical protein